MQFLMCVLSLITEDGPCLISNLSHAAGGLFSSRADWGWVNQGCHKSLNHCQSSATGLVRRCIFDRSHRLTHNGPNVAHIRIHNPASRSLKPTPRSAQNLGNPFDVVTRSVCRGACGCHTCSMYSQGAMVGQDHHVISDGIRTRSSEDSRRFPC